MLDRDTTFSLRGSLHSGRTMTIDEATAATLLHGNQADLKRLRSEVAVIQGKRCPECGHSKVEDNGAHGSELTYRCCSCDHRWEPADCSITVPYLADKED